MLTSDLYTQLKSIAKVCGGYVSLTTKEGVRIKTYDFSGEEIVELEGKVYGLAKKASETGQIQIGKSDIHKIADAWAIPFHDYVIAVSNLEKHERNQSLMRAMAKALPLIAKTAGGEAVLFDKEGRRINSFGPSGQEAEQLRGMKSQAALKAMQTFSPIISQSTSLHEATAVRIPITEEFGFGFNNELRVKNEKNLVAEIKKRRTTRYDLDDIVCQSPGMVSLKEHCCHVAKGNSSVLLLGETGTGKELFAQAIHNQSNRRDKPFVAINCGAIPASIIESYLFGYIGGSFTGAKRTGDAGAFEQANGGTIFLDEISEMDYDLQIKLLRVLQEREISRIGSFQPTKIDVRVISSSNKNLEELVRDGKMRIDLYYRLNVVALEVLPLRKRKEDIPLLAKHFVYTLDQARGGYGTEISPAAISILKDHTWPGNVRELQNVVERALNTLEPGEYTIEIRHLPPYISNLKCPEEPLPYVPKTLEEYLRPFEKDFIFATLKETKGNRKKAASILGISPTTLWRKVKGEDIESL